MRPDWSIMLAQRVLGFFCYVLFVLPYVRKVKGRPKKSGLYVCNHVSLLDTIALGGVFWSRRRLPILVLGDKATWRGGWFLRFLSARVGFLVERGRTAKALISDLRAFARRHQRFNLIVFPEGTRGDGSEVGECQPGIFYVAREAGVPIVPIRIDDMQAVSTKTRRFRPFGGLKKVRVTFGDEFEVGGRRREEFLALVREKLAV